MAQLVLSTLQEKGALAKDKKPMQPNQYDLTGGVPIIDIPPFFRGASSHFILYDNVTSPDGVTLIQGKGRVYHGRIRNGKLDFEVQAIDSPLPFGIIGIYRSDYFLANREFVNGLAARL